MKKIEVILKVTDMCNLRCKYCYNSDRGYAANCVSLAHFEKLLTVLLQEYNLIHILWHGGEPLCAGIKFFRKAMDVEERIRLRYGVTIENSIQTNGTLINKQWLEFFKKYKFRVGISFDGVENEKYRQQTDKTLDAMKKLRAAGISFGCLAVVADDEYDFRKNYHYFRDMGVSFDFSRVFAEGSAKGLPDVQAKRYAESCVDLFDEWLYDVNGVSIRRFAYYVCMAFGGNLRICECCSCHGKYICLAANGDLYNCAREGMGHYCFGNIQNVERVSDIFRSDGAIELLTGSMTRRNKCKQNCEYYSLCQGGCADMAIMEGDLAQAPTNYCYVFKTLYGHIEKAVKDILERKVPLTELNPAVKTALAKSLVIDGDNSSNETTGYQK